MMRSSIVPVLIGLLATAQAGGQTASLARLDRAVLDVTPPSERVRGAPGHMSVVDTQCPQQTPPDLRRHIVGIAAQEWGFFAFPVVDQTVPPPPGARTAPRPRRPPTWLDPEESGRVASSIAGYWTATPDGVWILARQNDIWRGPIGIASRWRDAWSAAFISWVMCAAGMSTDEQFERAIAHHAYIDQAIAESTTQHAAAAYVAYDVGDAVIEPGDLLCSSRRNGYRTIADRERHLGTAARTHCDIVVYVDRERARILTIGGNVRGTVSLKLQYAVADPTDPRLHLAVGHEGREIFAHLKLRAASVDDAAFLDTPTIRALLRDDALLELVERKLGMELGATVGRASS